MASTLAEHPRRLMTLIMVSGIGGQTISELAICVATLARSRTWLIGPPEFVNEFMDPEDLPSDEVPLNVTGVTFEIYSELEPNVLDAETQQRQNEDVTAFLRAIEKFSKAYGADFEMDLDGDQIGEIEDGQLDEKGIEGWLVDISD